MAAHPEIGCLSAAHPSAARSVTASPVAERTPTAHPPSDRCRSGIGASGDSESAGSESGGGQAIEYPAAVGRQNVLRRSGVEELRWVLLEGVEAMGAAEVIRRALVFPRGGIGSDAHAAYRIGECCCGFFFLLAKMEHVVTFLRCVGMRGCVGV